VLELVDHHFQEALSGVAEGRNGQDWKTQLQEQAQLKLKVSPRYRVVSQSGPDHEKVFEVEVTLGGEPYGRASGRSKKEAEQAAAKETLGRLQALDKQPE
jgi:ribonuclease-3